MAESMASMSRTHPTARESEVPLKKAKMLSPEYNPESSTTSLPLSSSTSSSQPSTVIPADKAIKEAKRKLACKGSKQERLSIANAYGFDSDFDSSATSSSDELEVDKIATPDSTREELPESQEIPDHCSVIAGQKKLKSENQPKELEQNNLFQDFAASQKIPQLGNISSSDEGDDTDSAKSLTNSPEKSPGLTKVLNQIIASSKVQDKTGHCNPEPDKSSDSFQNACSTKKEKSLSRLSRNNVDYQRIGPSVKNTQKIVAEKPPKYPKVPSHSSSTKVQVNDKHIPNSQERELSTQTQGKDSSIKQKKCLLPYSDSSDDEKEAFSKSKSKPNLPNSRNTPEKTTDRHTINQNRLIRQPNLKCKRKIFPPQIESSSEESDNELISLTDKCATNKENCRPSSSITLRTNKNENWFAGAVTDIPAFRKRFLLPDSAPPLTKEMLVAVYEAWQKSPKSLVHDKQKFDLPLTFANLQNFEYTNWLDDLTIDFYMQMIQARNNSSSDLPTIYVFHSLFYKIYHRNSHSYDVVHRTTDPDDIFEYDRIFIPIHLSDHWSLVYVVPGRKIIAGLDSLGKDLMPTLAAIREFLKCEYDKLRQREAVELDGENCKTGAEFVEGWTLFNAKAPMQTNYSDCGVFILQYAEYLARKQPFNFEQHNMPYFRQRMAFETIEGALLI